MGYADRDYFRDHATRPPGRLAGAPVVKWLLFLNLAVFVIQVVFEVAEPFVAWGGFTVEGGLQNLQLWRLISFQFLHDDFGHLLFNSFGLFLFGSFVEEAFRSRGFLVFYLVCGVVGALAGALLGVIVGDLHWYAVGASAGVFGTLAVAAQAAPNDIVRLWLPPVSLPLRRVALIFLVLGLIIAVFTILFRGQNSIGEAAHLGGALAGFLCWKVPALRSIIERLGREKRPGSARKSKVRTARETRKSKRRYQKKLRPQTKITKREANEVDRILDKINEHGLQSLTQEERDLLTRAGRK